MRELTINEIEQANGGNAVIAVVTLTVTTVGAMFAFGYSVGKDMAERDNARAEASSK